MPAGSRWQPRYTEPKPPVASMPPMSGISEPYVRVEDVPASWDRYASIARSVEHRPTGLLLHVAGPTDEGFRIVEVWADEAAWRQFIAGAGSGRPVVDPEVAVRAAVRDLHAAHLVIGRGAIDEQ